MTDREVVSISLSREDYNKIQEAMRLANVKNRSEYIRRLVLENIGFDGYDKSNMILVAIQDLARKISEGGIIYSQPVKDTFSIIPDDIKSDFDEMNDFFSFVVNGDTQK